jgi:hypothetical protein
MIYLSMFYVTLNGMVIRELETMWKEYLMA